MIFNELIPAKIRDKVVSKVIEISDFLAMDRSFGPDSISAVIYKESGWDPQAVNKQKNDPGNPYERSKYRATGLIQFMPKTAKGLGISNQQLYLMNSLQQLDYVKMYFAPAKNKISSYSDLYLYTFYPKALNKPDNYVIGLTEGNAGIIAAQNAVIDLNKDNEITVGEFKEYTLKGLPKLIQEALKKKA